MGSKTALHIYCKCVGLIFTKYIVLITEFQRFVTFLSNRRNLSTFQDISVVNIYFPILDSTLFHADVLMTWQEIVSKSIREKAPIRKENKLLLNSFR